jgi:hypothetical protein
MKEKDDAMEPRAVESASEPVSKRQSPRVWPLPKPWASEHAYAEEASALDDDVEVGELFSRGGWRVG